METKPYRLKHGHNHYHDGALVDGGGVVHLTDDQYEAFRDKFVQEGEPLPPPPVDEDQTDEDNEDDENQNDETENDEDNDDDQDDDESDDDDVEGEGGEPLLPPAEGEEESPIVRQRREKAEKKAAKKAAKAAKRQK